MSHNISLSLFFKRLRHNYLYFYFFVMILFAARAVNITGSMVYYTGSIISFLIPIILTIILLCKYPISFRCRKLTITLIVISFWFICQYIKYKSLNVSLTFYLYYTILIAYIHIRIYDWKIIRFYEDIVAHLSIFSLIGWGMQIVFPSLIHKLMIFSSSAGTISGSSLLYSAGRDYSEAIIFFRNAGFSWEPGMFASLLLVSIFFNLLLTQMNLNAQKNPKLYVMLLALITTQSTTGFGCCIIIFFLSYVYNYKSKIKWLLAALFIPISIWIYSLPFMGEKINELWVSNRKELVEQYKEKSEYIKSGIALTRFQALSLELYNIEHDPLIGYGRDDNQSYVVQNIFNFGLPNGLLKIFAKYGIPLGIIFYILLFKFSSALSVKYKYKCSYAFFTLYCLISVSYSFIESPIFLSFALFPLFIHKGIHKTLV